MKQSEQPCPSCGCDIDFGELVVPHLDSLNATYEACQRRLSKQGIPSKYSTNNARIETVETAASYRGPWQRGQRCLQVATGFYEWHLNSEGRKAPFYITVADKPVFAFAGLSDSSVVDVTR